MANESNLPKSPNQATRQSNQNFKIDINQMFTDWVGPIDNIRSFANVNTQNTLSSIISNGSSGEADITGISRFLKIETTVQESRCHAFFRWIGFPVVDINKNFYNPGHDIIIDSSRTLDLQKKKNIAIHPIDKFDALSNEREIYANGNLKIFSNPTSIDAGVLAISSGGTDALRKFIAPLEDSSGPFDMDASHQSYITNIISRVGNKKVTLDKYQDANGSKPSSNNILYRKRKHIIAPFIVDGRLEFSITPHSRLIAIPFLPDNSFSKVSPTEDARYPTLLERIIRERLSVTDPVITAGTSVNAVKDYVKSVPTITDDELIKKAELLVGPNGPRDQARFISSINTIRAMMQLLDKSVKYIRKVQGNYYWVPAPSIFGPEKGASVQGIFLPTIIDKDLLVTDADTKILISKSKGTISNNNIDVASVNGTPDPGNFGLKTATVTFGPDTSSAQGDNNSQNTDTLSQIRRREMERANDALRTVEIIMGEFSGLGLCDIVAIIGALNVITPESLVGFLDPDSYKRMQDFFPDAKDVKQNKLDTSMTDLTNAVKDFYNLMDKIYQDTSQNNNNSGNVPV